MKRTLISLLAAAVTAVPATAEGLLDNLGYNLRFGYGAGGTAPVGMPATIRSLESYKLTPNFTLGLDIEKKLGGKWGVVLGLHLENKGMNIDARVKNYHMAVIRGGQSLEGYFTGMNTTEVEQWMLTVPVQASYSPCAKVRLRAGPYVSYLRSREFTGYASGGYIRVGSPTGSKVEIGSEPGTRGTYDFSDEMRHMQAGVKIGADWFFHKQWGAFADLSWGLTGIFHSSFNTIEQTLYPIYGTVGVEYKL